MIIKKMRQMIDAKPSARIEYIKIVHPETLKEIKKIEGDVLIALAVRIGKARLIDNISVGKDSCK